MRSSARRAPSGVRRAAIACGLLLIGGLLAGVAGLAASASGSAGSRSQTASADLGYSCRFPSGEFRVGVRVVATFPATAVPGQRIAVTGIRVAAPLPHPVIAALRRSGAAAAGWTGTLATSQTFGATSVRASWNAKTAAPSALPAAGSLLLTATGTAPPVAAAGRGTVAFAVGGLAMTLTLRQADGKPARPAAVAVTCTLPGAGPAHLASVAVVAASPAASSVPGGPSGSPSPARSGTPQAKVRAPKGCGRIRVVGTGVATCGYLTGYSDVRKLFGAALLQPRGRVRPALVNLDFAERHSFKHHKLVEVSTARLYFHGKPQLPQIRATFLAFRFVPVTATLQLTELSPIKIISVSGITAPPFPITVRASTRLSLRISKVKVNGVPLPVGPRCRPRAPIKLTLIGRGDNTLPPRGYTVPTGGPLSGRLTIPPFTDCGVGENLDALLTGSISGPGNFVKVTQGKLCGPSQPANWTCPPPVPKPIR